MTYNEFIKKCSQLIPELISSDEELKDFEFEITGVKQNEFSFTMLYIKAADDESKSLDLLIPYLMIVGHEEELNDCLKHMLKNFFEDNIFGSYRENNDYLYDYIQIGKIVETNYKCVFIRDTDSTIIPAVFVFPHEEEVLGSRITSNSPITEQMALELGLEINKIYDILSDKFMHEYLNSESENSDKICNVIKAIETKEVSPISFDNDNLSKWEIFIQKLKNKRAERLAKRYEKEKLLQEEIEQIEKEIEVLDEENKKEEEILKNNIKNFFSNLFK